ncbi:MAG TPA: pyridoxamine 5'-phosphate oxidase family protein [Terracidiphilus sp.]|jgi:pyridoxine/pyridoxamine 5'-phosphate oxidase|nr:pyridoxamine 5'-phosphate oxidase family protein [Terracidiphilus sp.]HEX4283967.1 pyridoxamine 5'-phosphate oxidase family protein [Terracidiphilus sp.]
MDKPALYAFMSHARYGVVASLAADGTPQSAIVGVAITTELDIVFDTLKTTRKYANLTARPACSVTLWWGGEQTVQVDGAAFEPAGADLEQARAAYFSVWPDGRERLSWAGMTHLVVRPRWMRVVDYDQSPTMIEELSFPL